MDCQFCTEFAGAEKATRIIIESDGWVLLPTVGCFTPGYCLLMPVEHIDAVADAGHGLSFIQDLVEDMRHAIAAKFGPTIVAEHGPRDCDLGASCCSHAHLHLIPVPEPEAVTGAYRRTGGPGQSLGGIIDLAAAADTSYLYLSPRPGEHLMWPSTGFTRQYVRRVCAALYGLDDTFDWREHPYQSNQALTLAVMRSALQPTSELETVPGGPPWATSPSSILTTKPPRH